MTTGNLTKKKGLIVQFETLTDEQKEQLRGPAGKEGPTSLNSIQYWQPNTFYSVGQIVYVPGVEDGWDLLYQCESGHLSGASFSNELWRDIGGIRAQLAGQAWWAAEASNAGYAHRDMKGNDIAETYATKVVANDALTLANNAYELATLVNMELGVVKEDISSLSAPTYAYVNILGGADNWTPETVTDSSGNVSGVRYGQTVNVNKAVITERSKVDLQISSEQMVIFYKKDLAFVTENDDGVITVYCVGNIPENDYRVQVAVTEVVVNG